MMPKKSKKFRKLRGTPAAHHDTVGKEEKGQLHRQKAL